MQTRRKIYISKCKIGFVKNQILLNSERIENKNNGTDIQIGFDATNWLDEFKFVTDQYAGGSDETEQTEHRTYS